MKFKGILYTISFDINSGFYYRIHGKAVTTTGNFTSFDAAQTAAHTAIAKIRKNQHAN